jgi:hypothetical protein
MERGSPFWGHGICVFGTEPTHRHPSIKLRKNTIQETITFIYITVKPSNGIWEVFNTSLDKRKEDHELKLNFCH